MDSTKQKMLKKARSFRDRIRRGTGVRGLTRAESPVKTLPPPIAVSPPMQAQLVGGVQDQPHGNIEASAMALAPATEKISSEYKKVNQAIKFMLYAVEKVNLVMLPGSATVTLETTLELISTVTALLASHDESSLMSAHLKKVYNALADLIQWADAVMLTPSPAAVSPPTPTPVGPNSNGSKQKQLDADSARHVISSLDDSVKELADLAAAKAAQYAPPLPLPDAAASNTSAYSMATLPKGSVKKSSSVNLTDKIKRNSLPEIPLTPREKTILKETSYGAFDNPLLGHGEPTTPSRIDEPGVGPPPKPYLPPDFDLRSVLPCASSSAVDGMTPPQLPSKRRDRLFSSDDVPVERASDELLQQACAAQPVAAAPPIPSSPGSARSSMSSGDDLLSVGLNGSRSYNRYSSGDELEDARQRSRKANSHHRPEVVMRSTSGFLRLPHTDAVTETGLRRANSDYDNVEDDDEVGDTREGKASIFVYPEPQPPAGGYAMGFARRGVSDWSHVSAAAGASGPGVPMSAQIFGNAWGMQRHQQLYGGFVKSASESETFASAGATSHLVPTESNSVSALAMLASVTQDLVLNHPPPLPPKRRHIESYMNVFGPYSVGQCDYSPPSATSLMHSRRFFQNVQEQHQFELFHSRFSASSTGALSSPFPSAAQLAAHSAIAASASSQDYGRPLPAVPAKQLQRQGTADAEPPKSASMVGMLGTTTAPVCGMSSTLLSAGLQRPAILSPTSSPSCPGRVELPEAEAVDASPLDRVDVSPYLIREKQSPISSRQSYPELKGGPIDALVVYATYCPKQDFMYQEAFLTTYRTFISPSELIDKLLYRYHKFGHVADDSKRRISRFAFALLVRVVDELSTSELTDSISQLLLQLVCDLVREGELTLARILRKKVLEKVDPTQRPVDVIYHVMQLKPIKPFTLLDFSALDIAEQMTLMDKEFYERLDIAELLIWSKSQDEERCVNLVQFTAHFNKMSWWCRTLILLADDPTTREKYFLKFVKVLKHLRKLNNFNSFLAMLSALDSAPVRRLDWPKQATEVIKDFSVLIDSSSSFKAYRTALSEADPPCIPYIGIILQDMTFIRMGSMPLLPDGNINFVMRWQLFNVLECLRRFRKPDYGFKKNPKTVHFLNNFDECVTNDDDLWERSKQLKPTATR